MKNEKKKFDAGTVFGLLPKQCCEKKKNCIARFQLYCNLKGVVGWFVLQCEEYCKMKGLCIAIQSVYCKWEGLEWLLKKNYIAIQLLYCRLEGGLT